MALYDRDYMHRPLPRGGFASVHMWSVTTWLIVINVAVFLIDQMTPQWRVTAGGHRSIMGTLEAWGFFSVTAAMFRLQLWRFLSFQFLHASLGHLFGNMLALYLFGQIVESYFGRKRFLGFYLICGLGGALGYMLLWTLRIPLIYSADMPLIGASAGVFGVLIAAAWLAPNVQIMLLFPPVSLRLKTLAWFMMLVAAYTVYTHGRNAGGEAAHIGGGLLGLGFMTIEHYLHPLSRPHPPYEDPTDQDN